jgi:hypothetical protein
MRTTLRRLGWPLVLLAVTAFPTTLLAQGVRNAASLKEEQPYIPWAIGVAFLAATLIVLFKKPRRGPEHER